MDSGVPTAFLLAEDLFEEDKTIETRRAFQIQLCCAPATHAITFALGNAHRC